MASVRLRTTVVMEYECHEFVADDRCNRLTPSEKAGWVSHYLEHPFGALLVSAVTERLDRPAGNLSRPAEPVPTS